MGVILDNATPVITHTDFSHTTVTTTTQLLEIDFDISASAYYEFYVVGKSFEFSVGDETYQMKIELYNSTGTPAWEQVSLKNLNDSFEETVETIKYIQVSDKIYIDYNIFTKARVSIVLGGAAPSIDAIKAEYVAG
jgi:hypothetical protein